jgi:hypothetical protein
MTIPGIALSLVFSLLVGSLFHIWQDGGPGRLLYYLALSIAGFFVGQWIGTWRNWNLFPIGTVNFGVATAGSLLFLGIGYWLGLVDIRRTKRRDNQL